MTLQVARLGFLRFSHPPICPRVLVFGHYDLMRLLLKLILQNMFKKKKERNSE